MNLDGTTVSLEITNMVRPQNHLNWEITNPANKVEQEVLSLMSGTLGKFVPKPKKNEVMADLLIGLKRFRNTLRWKEFFLFPELHKNNEKQTKNDDRNNNNNCNENEKNGKI